MPRATDRARDPVLAPAVPSGAGHYLADLDAKQLDRNGRKAARRSLGCQIGFQSAPIRKGRDVWGRPAQVTALGGPRSGGPILAAGFVRGRWVTGVTPLLAVLLVVVGAV